MAHIDIVFDGPPSHESGRFVEVEDSNGRSITVGEWICRDDGFWVLRLPCHNGTVINAHPDAKDSETGSFLDV